MLLSLRRSKGPLAVVFCFWLLDVGCIAYQGFDCGQGTALMRLASHHQCGELGQVACFESFAMRVRSCKIKAWPKQPRKAHRPCWGIQVLANVTNVNKAQGLLSGPIRHSGRHASVPVSLDYSRPEEAMHVRYGECLLVFDVQPATESSIRPVPGEDTGIMSSLLGLLLPALLVPAVCVGLIVAIGSLSTTRSRSSGDPDADSDSIMGSTSGVYTFLSGGPDEGGSGSSNSNSRDRGHNHGPGTSLLLRTFNLKAMSKRARARRLRRSARPVYVGVPHEGYLAQQMYAAGRLPPGPLHLVAPSFRFLPVAAAPGLPAIPEGTSGSSSNAPSRTSSCPDVVTDALGSGEADASLPLLLMDAEGGATQQHQQLAVQQSHWGQHRVRLTATPAAAS